MHPFQITDFKEFYRWKAWGKLVNSFSQIEILNMIDLVWKVLKSEWKHFVTGFIYIRSHSRQDKKHTVRVLNGGEIFTLTLYMAEVSE